VAGYTQAQIDALKAAIADGVLSVSFNGRTTNYRSLEDMLRTLAVMEAEIQQRPRAFVLTADKGL
jgi:hypothetical protein